MIGQVCQAKKSFIGYKKLRFGCIAKIRIPSGAKYIQSSSGKFRCSEAYVEAIWGSEGERYTAGQSMFDPAFVYMVGVGVAPDDFCDDPLIECAPGIHFFLTEKEAERFYMLPHAPIWK